MHDLGFDHEHEAALSDAERLAIASAIWEQETVDLLTVGLDIGSSTSHLLFARVVLRRETNELSSRFVPVERKIVWRSAIMLTPFLPDGSIDADALRHFKDGCYNEARIARDDVDSGAVILTGEAIKRHNARAIDDIFAAEAGRFVCATAGHRLESMLAAQGSGAVALSQKRGQRALHVDIGGGTTKLAMIDRGIIEGVAAFAIGGRLLAQDSAGNWTRIDDAGRMIAESLGIAPTAAAMADAAAREKMVGRMADLLLDEIVGAPLDALGEALLLTAPLSRGSAPDYVTFSGGVAEYLFQYEERSFGDIARPLARAIATRLATRLHCPVIDPGQRIRATVIGASQFTVQVSGNTLHLDDAAMLPLRNVPVARLPRPISEFDTATLADEIAREAELKDLKLDAPLAVSFAWTGAPDHAHLLKLARAVQSAVGTERRAPLVIAVDADIALTLGRLLKQELAFTAPLVCIDGIRLGSLDYIDVGELLMPANVVPVVIKSLLFS